MRRTSMRHVIGRTAVGAVVLSATVVSVGGGTAAAETPDGGTTAAAVTWTVDTDAPAGLTPLVGGGFSATVPYDVCSVDWTLIGGRGGADSGGVAGEAGGELRVTTHRSAGQVVSLHPGAAGQDGTSGGAGGTNGTDSAGGAGSPDGAAHGGGGGAGSSVLFSQGIHLGAHGGTGGGATGGVGGRVAATPTGNTADPGHDVSVPIDRSFDGDTDDLGGTGRTGAGVVRGVGVSCPATVPGAPRLLGADPTHPDDGVIRVRLQPETPRAHEVWAPVTGWEVTLDGGRTWNVLPTEPLSMDGFRPGTVIEGGREGYVRGLASGRYELAVRATSAIGPSASTRVQTVHVLGTPTGITVADVSVTAGVSSLRVSWTPATGEVRGYIAESYDAAQDGEGIPFSLCETTAEVHSCVLAAQPGRSYRVVVSSGGRAAAPVTSGVVAAPPVPAKVPSSSGELQVPAGTVGALAAGDVVDAAGSGYLAGSTVTVVVYSTPVVLDSVVAGDGSIDASVTLPAGLPAGEHTLVATGVAPDGETWNLTRPITVQDPTAAAAPAAPAVPPAGALAYTGAYVGTMAVGGAGVLVLGVVVLFSGRRRRTVPRD